MAGWLALWWLATALQWVPPLFLPAPEAALNALAQAWRGDIQGGDALWVHAQWSCLRVFGAFALAVLTAVPVGIAMGVNRWAQAVFDTLGSVTNRNVIDEVLARDMLEVLPLTHIRGRSLHDAFVIVDEAQSLERNVLLTVLSRIGQNSRVVLTHDVAQRDNLRVGRHDGVAAVVEKLKGNPLFGHVTLTRSERSPIAALVTEMLEDLPL